MRLSENTQRRLHVYGRRALRCAAGGLDRPCLFVHLPKCGGTSLANALYATVPLHRPIAVVDAVSTRRAAAILAFGRDDPWLCHEDLDAGHHTFALRERLALSHMAQGMRLVHGHIPLTPRIARHFSTSYRIVTVLRDPVERAVSNFRMAVRAGLIGPDIDQWLASPLAQRHATAYLRYFSGSWQIAHRNEAAALARAEAALSRISLIGFLDEMPDFTRRFREMFGVSLALPHLNAAPDQAPPLSASQRARLEALCVPDLVLYAAARRAACADAADIRPVPHLPMLDIAAALPTPTHMPWPQAESESATTGALPTHRDAAADALS
ncbi:MAG: hypothetical protein AAGD12_03990 [Pseudomonadota bacterium]